MTPPLNDIEPNPPSAPDVSRRPRAGTARLIYLALAVAYCLCAGVTNARAQGGSIVINPPTADVKTISVTWTDGGTNYPTYNVKISGSIQYNTTTEFFQFTESTYGLIAGNPYTVSVEGCFSSTHLGSDPAGCSPWATVSGTIPFEPPQNVHAAVGKSDVNVTWTNPADGTSNNTA